MAAKLLGNKDSFAIEYESTRRVGPLHYGQCGVWIGGVLLQDFDVEVFLESVLSDLIGLRTSATHFEVRPTPPVDANTFLKYMEGNGGVDAVDRHFFLAIEGFDDFLKLYFKGMDETIFWIALHPAASSLSGRAIPPEKVYSFSVKNREISEVVAEFESDLHSLA